MVAFVIAALASVAFAVATDIYDIVKTREVITQKGGNERNQFLVGPKPSARALALRDTLILALATAPAVTFALIGVPGGGFGALVGPVIYGIKHFHGGRVNQSVLDTGKYPVDPMTGGPGRSWLWKLIHNW